MHFSFAIAGASAAEASQCSRRLGGVRLRGDRAAYGAADARRGQERQPQGHLRPVRRRGGARQMQKMRGTDGFLLWVRPDVSQTPQEDCARQTGAFCGSSSCVQGKKLLCKFACWRRNCTPSVQKLCTDRDSSFGDQERTLFGVAWGRSNLHANSRSVSSSKEQHGLIDRLSLFNCHLITEEKLVFNFALRQNCVQIRMQNWCNSSPRAVEEDT